jgi:hypothetical protein
MCSKLLIKVIGEKDRSGVRDYRHIWAVEQGEIRRNFLSGDGQWRAIVQSLCRTQRASDKLATEPVKGNIENKRFPLEVLSNC